MEIYLFEKEKTEIIGEVKKMKYFKIELVVEGTDPFEIDELAIAIVNFRSSDREIYYKSVSEMTEEEASEFFGGEAENDE